MSRRQVLEAELTLTPAGWRRGTRVGVEGGRIAFVEAARPGDGGDTTDTLQLPGRALVPGMVNAHSHAFQRGLRGRGETFPEDAGSFWSWREAMYELVESLDAASAYDLSHRAFSEMRTAGVTSVGEFHYLHHDESGDGWAFDDIVLRAAADAGIRLVLLNACYRTGGIGEELSGGQLRFRTASLEAYWRQMDRLAERLDPALQSLGVVAHSIRAVPIEEIAELHEEASARDMVFHMHLEEQPAEIEACRRHYGATPMGLVLEHLALDGRTTMVHCTHTARREMAAYLETGGRICLCPLTEANLGDGLADVPLIVERGGRICLGTDSNARISLLEEMRLLEYGQRLRTTTRGIVRDPAGAVAPALWRCGTLDGAHALDLDAGEIAPGKLADFAVIDLDHPALAGCHETTLLATLLLGAPDDVVRATCVGGEWSGRPGSA